MRIDVALLVGCLVATPTVAFERNVEHWIIGCGEVGYTCESFRRDWTKALAGDAVAQHNMPLYFNSGGRGAIVNDPEFGCAWEIVYLASRHPGVRSVENSSLRAYCGRDLVRDFGRARALAEELFREIRHHPLPDPPWEIVDPVAEVRLPSSREAFARMAVSARIMVESCPGARIDGDRLDALGRRAGVSGGDVAIGGDLFGAASDQSAKLRSLGRLTHRDPAEACRALVDDYGRRGRALQAIAIVPVPDDYPN